MESGNTYNHDLKDWFLLPFAVRLGLKLRCCRLEEKESLHLTLCDSQTRQGDEGCFLA
jgi:hypothetical protein